MIQKLTALAALAEDLVLFSRVHKLSVTTVAEDLMSCCDL